MNINNNQQHEIESQDKRINQNLEAIDNRIVVFSGKGGVGKTTVSVNLAYALVQAQKMVGLLDADITGPNVQCMAGVNEKPIMVGEKQFAPHMKNGLALMSIASMIPENQPVIWRGPLRSGVIAQFLADVFWSDLDFLLADLPPGTGDEVLTAAQKMKPQMAIVVTTPQEVSLIDCRRAVNMARKLDIPHIGVVENMSGFVCPHCNKEVNLFGKEGGRNMAEAMEVPFLGSLPMEIAVREGGDTGQPIVLAHPDSVSAKAFFSISEKVQDLLKSNR